VTNKRETILLDVNALVALFDEAHVHHEAAHAWFQDRRSDMWVTCPITENGLLRILSHPAYPNSPAPMTDIAERLEAFKSVSGNYHWWDNDYSMSGWLADRKLPIGSSHSTDAYLLNLCMRNKGVLATFDRRIKPSLIGESSSHFLQYIPT
jgi:toxin-antitoxin system PIN domain toxin